MPEIKLEKEIDWDGECLSVWAVTPTSRIRCEIPRDTIIIIYPFTLTRSPAK
jgi:hypothetical protein